MLNLFDGFIAAVRSETHIDFEKTEEGTYIARVEFEGGRKQKVLVSLGKDDAGDSTIEYFSKVCHVPEGNPEFFKNALKTNVSLTYCGLALMNDELILQGTTVLQDLDPQVFIKYLSYVAAMADQLEEELTHADKA